MPQPLEGPDAALGNWTGQRACSAWCDACVSVGAYLSTFEPRRTAFYVEPVEGTYTLARMDACTYLY